jgi:hypothetical protein
VLSRRVRAAHGSAAMGFIFITTGFDANEQVSDGERA